MLIDIIKRDMKTEEKILWILVLIFLTVLGPILYYFVVYRKNEKRVKTTNPKTKTIKTKAQ